MHISLLCRHLLWVLPPYSVHLCRSLLRPNLLGWLLLLQATGSCSCSPASRWIGQLQQRALPAAAPLAGLDLPSRTGWPLPAVQLSCRCWWWRLLLVAAG